MLKLTTLISLVKHWKKSSSLFVALRVMLVGSCTYISTRSMSTFYYTGVHKRSRKKDCRETAICLTKICGMTEDRWFVDVYASGLSGGKDCLFNLSLLVWWFCASSNKSARHDLHICELNATNSSIPVIVAVSVKVSTKSDICVDFLKQWVSNV